MLAQFASYGLAVVIFLPILLVWAWRRSRYTGSLVVREEYRILPDGCLQAGIGMFDPNTKTVMLHNEQGKQSLPFERITGIIIFVRTSRKIHIGLLVQGQEEPLHLSIVTNHDLKLAGINAHQLAAFLTGDGDPFLEAFKSYEWPTTLIGTKFVYPFDDVVTA